jgi:hypothetical protein
MEIDIESGLHNVLEAKKQLYPCHVNRISALDDPCLRRLYYMRAAWDKATPTDDGLQGIFETGNILEPAIMRIVSEVGLASTPPWRIIGTQMPTNDALLSKYQISGTIDGLLQVMNGQWVTQGVVDGKTSSPNIYPQLVDYESLSRYPWTRKYRGQLMLYSLAHNLEMCYILFVNKSNLFDMRLISFPVDMAYCESLLTKAETVNRAIDNQTPPKGVNDPDECPKCRWFSHCAPDLETGGNLEVVDNDELQAILDRMEGLQEASDKYKELAKVRDKMLVKGKDIACGSWLVHWKKMDKHFNAQPAKQAFDRSEWRKTITKIAS